MIEFFKKLFFVRKCLVCEEILTDSKAEGVFCPKCRLEYEKLKRRTCPACGKPQSACGCMPDKLKNEVAWAVHLFAYADPLSKTVIFTLKRRDFKALQAFLGKELASLFGDVADYEITFAPRKPKSVREYGFDQAEALARAIADEKDIPFADIFTHARKSELQKNLSAAERAENAEKSYTLQKAFVREREKLIIVDDVMTTGSTMAKLVSLAKEAGYKEIATICVAKTIYEKETR
jgi:ComF family protein